jgi:hypothetical protein
MQLQALTAEDDLAGGLPVVQQYPKFETRPVSEFEDDLRFWGFVYGLAFGLAVRDNPELSHEDAARLAYKPAYRRFVQWSGDIENPVEKREAAIRTLVRRFAEADQERDNGRVVMTAELQDAVLALTQTARG